MRARKKFLTLTQLRSSSATISLGQMRSFFVQSEETKLKSHLITMMETAADDVKQAEGIAKSSILPAFKSVYDANLFCNHFLQTSEEFRLVCETTVAKQMQRTTPNVKWKEISPTGNPVPVFRYLSMNDQYGLPDKTYEAGMPVALFDMRKRFNDRKGSTLLSEAKVVTYTVQEKQDGAKNIDLTIPGRHDMLGFIFGPIISTSLRFGHVAGHRFQYDYARYKQDGHVYLMAITHGYNSADAIYSGSGYVRNREAGLKGHKGVSGQEDACEIGAGVYIPKHLILGSRKLFSNGTLGEFIPNDNADASAFSAVRDYVDTQLFLQVNKVEDLQQIEALMDPEHHKHENFHKRIVGFHSRNKALNSQIRMDALTGRANGMGASAFVSGQHSGNPHTLFCQESLEIYTLSNRYKSDVACGNLKDGKKFFEERKLVDEEALKRCAKQANDLLVETDLTSIKNK
jgi:hypothetical protein